MSNMSNYKIKKDTTPVSVIITDGVMKNIAKYFRMIDYSTSDSNFKQVMQLLFKPLYDYGFSIDFSGGSPIANLKKDIPQEIWFRDTPASLEKSFLEYYEKLYDELCSFKKNNFSNFYNTLYEGFIHLQNNLTTRLVGKEFFVESFSQYLKKLIDSNNTDPDPKKLFSQTLYGTIFFISTGRIFPDISENVFRQDDDWSTFIDRVVIPYSANSLPGTYAILKLADEGNSVAIYELYSIYYYGRINGIRNFEKAYECLKEAALNTKTRNMTALWDMAYFLYYYRNPEHPNNELANITIPQIEDNHNLETPRDRKRRAARYARESFDGGCLAAANLLGIIKSDPDVPANEKEDLLPSVEYWTYAADRGGYVYAHNNLYAYYCDLAKKENDKEKKNEYNKKAIDYLKKAANLYEPWSCNALARKIFGEGKKEEAHTYWLRAFSVYHKWSCYNMLENLYLPAYKGTTNYDFLDSSITAQLLVDICIKCDNNEIVEKTKNLLKDTDAPELLEPYI